MSLADSLTDAVGRLPRHRLACLPTPLQEAPRLSNEIGGPRLFIKRDDLTGLAFGGNKIRIMEFHVGAALAAGANVLIGGGGHSDSNHSRACAAAARHAGLRPVIVTRPGPDTGGNSLVTRLVGADVRVAPELETVPDDRLAELEVRRAVFEAIAAEEASRGFRPYLVLGTSTPLGVIGYALAAAELEHQMRAMGIAPDWVVVTSQGATQAGLELGARLIGAAWRVMGISYAPSGGRAAATVAHLAGEGAKLLGRTLEVAPDDVVNLEDTAGSPSGEPSAQALAALALAAGSEGLLLDPVYTGAGLAGLISAVASGRIQRDQLVVFVHTGGQPALFDRRWGGVIDKPRLDI